MYAQQRYEQPLSWYRERHKKHDQKHECIGSFGVFLHAKKTYRSMPEDWWFQGTLSRCNIGKYREGLEGSPNCNIASAYIQAHHIASKVIQEKGFPNSFFPGAGGDLHCGVRNDFIESEEWGLMRKDKKFIAAPNPSNDQSIRT
jgi:hypothetical protein